MIDNVPSRAKLTLPHGTYEFEGSEAFVGYQVERALSLVQPDRQRHSTSPVGSDQFVRLSELLETKRPTSHLERFMVMAAFIHESDQREAVSGEDITKLYVLMGVKPPAAPVQILRDGKSRYGYFAHGTLPGTYVLTPLGARFVERSLPRV